MLFSIITVCFNSAKTIRQTFDSVLQQECKDYEYIVIDGASTDGTVDIIKEYEPKFEGRMRWISEPDKGVYNAMNKGIRLAQGDFCAFMNSDDYYEPHAFRMVAEAIKQYPGFNLYYGIVRGLDSSDQEKYLSRNSHNNLGETCICHQSMFIGTRLLRDSGGYDETFRIVADHDLLLRISLDHTGKFFPLDFIVANYREGGISADGAARRLEFLRMQAKNGVIAQKQYRSLCRRYRWKIFLKRFF